MTNLSLECDVPPYRLSGTVYAALLNHAPQVDALGAAVTQPPYKAAPKAPVLALRPRNTLARDGAMVEVPEGVEALEIGASLGIVIGRVACRVAPVAALGVVAGYTIVNDLCVPSGAVNSHYRPGVRFRARDGFCVIGPGVVSAAEVPDPDALSVRVLIDGAPAQATSTAGRIRGVAQLIADVTDFMTLLPGDLLLLGAAHGAPRAGAGRSVSIEIEGLGCLTTGLVAEGERA